MNTRLFGWLDKRDLDVVHHAAKNRWMFWEDSVTEHLLKELAIAQGPTYFDYFVETGPIVVTALTRYRNGS